MENGKMDKKNIILFALVIAVLVLLALVFVKPSKKSPAENNKTTNTLTEDTSSQKVPVKLWFYYPTQVGGDLATGMEEIVNDFNEKNENINVTAVYTGSYKQTAQKAMTDLAAKNGPNVILSGMLDMVDYHEVNEIEDLTTWIEGEGDDFRGDFIEGFWESFELEEGKYFGLPYQHSVAVLYYNKDILDKAGVKVPSNWEEMIDAVQKLVTYDSKLIPIEFPSDPWIIENLTLSNGGKLMNGVEEPNFDDEKTVAALDFMDSMIENGGMIMDYAAAAEDFVAGNYALMINTTGNLGFVSKDANFNWDVAMIPIKSKPALTYGGGGLIMTSSQTDEEKEASWEFMKYMTSPEVSAKWMEISGYFSVRKSAEKTEIAKRVYKKIPQLKTAADMLQYSSGQWRASNYWSVNDAIKNALDEVLVGQNKSAKDALTNAQHIAEDAVKTK